MLISNDRRGAEQCRDRVLVFILGPASANGSLRTPTGHTVLFLLFILLYACNMYFQSFGAVSIVKVNSAWFHVRERGVFGGSSDPDLRRGLLRVRLRPVDRRRSAHGEGRGGPGDREPAVRGLLDPGALLLGAALWIFLIVRDRPGEAGFANFDTGDASSARATAPIRSA